MQTSVGKKLFGVVHLPSDVGLSVGRYCMCRRALHVAVTGLEGEVGEGGRRGEPKSLPI